MSKVKIEIKNRWTGLVLFEYEKENNTLKDTLEEAIKNRANLSEADLRGAYIYLSDYEIDITKVIEEFKEKNNIKIIEYYINKNIIPTKWSCFWKYGLIICNYEIAKPIKKMTTAEAEKEDIEYQDRVYEEMMRGDL